MDAKILKMRKRLQIIRERERSRSLQESDKKDVVKNAKNIDTLDSFGFPSTTKDGHPLQSLVDLDQKTLHNQTNITLLLFYAYVEPSWNPKQYKQALEFSQKTAEEHQITGRLRVATEGFNGTMTGESNNVRRFCLAIKHYNPAIFGRVDFKLTDNLPPGQAFPQLKVFPVQEIVNYGLGDKQPSLSKGGIHLNAEEYHEKMKEENTVIVDVRNTYEACIGKFQPPPGGAKYIDPKMRVSTEFPKWVTRIFYKG
jgi:predicted sulfurtransferase